MNWIKARSSQRTFWVTRGTWRTGHEFTENPQRFAKSFSLFILTTGNNIMSGAAAYTVTASWLHWATALPMIGCVGSVLKAQQSPKEEKGKWMFRHKSLGLLSALVVGPRLAYRVLGNQAFKVQKLEGAHPLEVTASKVVHYALYGFMAVMPATGIAMGYYGGKGLPFFYTTLPGIVKTDANKASTGAIAKQVTTTTGPSVLLCSLWIPAF